MPSQPPDQQATVFVLGAGASNEVGLPVGFDLKTDITKCLNFQSEGGRIRSGDPVVLDALKIAAKSGAFGTRPFTDIIGAGRRIAYAMPQAISIDNFIDVHNGDKIVELAGKLAIARAILQAEKKSKLKLLITEDGATISFHEISNTYLSFLFQLLTENRKFENLQARLRRVAFVVFNYDRCIEHYLHYAVRNYYGVTAQDATLVLTSLRVFHPYGSIGALPTQPNGTAVDFGAETTAHQLLSLAAQIKTFTEGTDPNSSDILEIRDALHLSTRIVFLGFAYHKLNIKLFSLPSAPKEDNASRRVYGTAVGISASDIGLITEELADCLNCYPQLIELRKDLRCAGLFGEYWRSLSFA